MVSAKKYAKGHHGGRKMVCRVCLQDHPLRFCKKFLQVEYKERMQLVTIYKYCAGCPSHDHTWRTCESTGKCKRCGDMHHTLLHKPGSRPRSSVPNIENKIKRSKRGPRSSTHPKRRGPSSQSSARGPRSSNGQESEGPSTSQALVPSLSGNLKTNVHQGLKRQKQVHDISTLPVYQLTEVIILRPTAIVKIVCGERYIFERVLIDPGAECSIVSEEVADRLNVKLVRVGNKKRVLLSIRGNHGMSVTVETAEIRRRYHILTPQKSVDGKIVEEFPGLLLADPQFHVATSVQITLGGDVYSRIIRNGVMGGSFGRPLAQFTIFGYIISGSCSQ